MSFNKSETWKWKDWEISWSLSKTPNSKNNTNILLIHGFGASKKHWRHNQNFLGKIFKCYAIDLLGFGESSQPSALLNYETYKENSIKYSFDLWSKQISTFCSEVIKSPVYLVGNSIGGVIVGGSGNNHGSILGGFIIWFFWVQSEPIGIWLINLLTSGMSDTSELKIHLIESAAHMRLMTMGIILLLMLRFAPRGILPEEKR